MTKIYFATNRNPKSKDNQKTFGKKFNQESFDSLLFGSAQVLVKKVKSIEVAPEKLDKEDDKAKLGSRAVFSQLMADMQKGIDTLVFIHGYNVSFEEALLTGGEICRAYKGPKGINVVVFSWPSDGSKLPFFAYKRDRSDAEASAQAFSRALLKLAKFLDSVRRGTECGAKIYLMCHSMGNYVLRNGIQDVRRQASGIPRLFDEIFLMAADEDHDSFEYEHKLAPLPDMGNSVHVYFNSGDTALVISDKTKSNPARLGSRGPRCPLSVPGNVNIVDASEVVEGFVEHDYFVSSPTVVRDVRQVLAGKAADMIKKRRYIPAQNRYILVK